MCWIRYGLAGPRVGLLVIALLTIALRAQAQDRQPEQENPDGGGAETTGADTDGAASEPDEDGLQPYETVVTDDALSDHGVFTVHRLDDKVFYEIPVAELGREFLWVSQISRTTE